MNARPKNLEALLGSRICHDLISPIGAIGNGLELLALTTAADGPEMAMIQESVDNAQARIRYYRVAYGTGSSGQYLSRQEISDVISGIYGGSRLSVTWVADGDVLRDEAKLIFLLLQCTEMAMAYGGTIDVSRSENGWTLNCEAKKLRDLGPLWGLLTGDGDGEDLTPAQIQFALAAIQAEDMGVPLSVLLGADRITLSF